MVLVGILYTSAHPCCEENVMSHSRVITFDGDDPDMLRAFKRARKTFRYFWREVSWDQRRIIPALDMACVKAPFSDGNKKRRNDGNPDVEHMWMNEIEFDGKRVSGVLMNSPNWLTSVKEGDEARFLLEEISDWMYSFGGEVYGAFTVNVLRSGMGRKERREHDEMWGLDFGDPDQPRIMPDLDDDDDETEEGEHPMSKAMAAKVKEQLAENRSLVTDTDDRGWTLLHQEALAGNYAIVRALLRAGADPKAKTPKGWTAIDLAESLGWDRVVELLERE